MEKIKRFYDLGDLLKPNKVLTIFGPRQVGKTTLLKDFLKTTKLKYRFDLGEDLRLVNIFENSDFSKILDYASGYELIVIDEAQKIKDIGQGLKILVDNTPKLKVIVTGSSSFELAGQVGEPLTGRKNTITLYPISYIELSNKLNKFDLTNSLEEYLIYGMYPEVLTTKRKEDKKEVLSELSGSYVLKDILEFEKVKGSKVLIDLLRLLAFQIGSEVSLNELGNNLNIDVKTVGRYLDILEKAFVLLSLRGYSRNLRNEINRKNKYYFYDNGIRNSLIANFNSLEMRNDIGALWENFLIMERIKKQSYKKIYSNNYFWRTWDKKEIDFIEERNGKLFGFEFKWGNKKIKEPALWKKTYKEAQYKVINRDNYLDFIL